ncbi:BioY family transporter [Weizmannia acidilactici]|uniref:biotin transporter BioY n=1 Tax=Weizmannia acidilactici TaxID=2607726 RepID=UPI00124F45BD|nr:biotin transporter BioY [Weizmannia acidilactici]GER66750.1 BioY family transporter [Weizmannia acidilactici]
MSAKKFRAIDLCYAGMFAALMAIGTNITSIAPFLVVGGVPITLQTFFAVLAGAVLGSMLGALSMVAYMLIGLLGAPVFAQFSGGFQTVVSPSFGFILSFIAAAYATGKVIEKRQNLTAYFIAAIIGLVLNYFIGTNWMYAAYKIWAQAPQAFSYKMAWLWMAVPLPKDIILSLFAGWLAHRIRAVSPVIALKR